MKRLLVSISIALMACAAYALPTVTEVQAEVQKGNYTQAQTMMHEVVVAKPGSAKAHYIYAEILAHNGKFGEAAAEAQQAQRIEPSLAFTQPEKFRAFEQSLERARQAPAVTPRAEGRESTLDKLGPTSLQREAPVQRAQAAPETRAGLPGWLLPVGLIALLFIGWRVFAKSRRGAAAANPMAAAGGLAGAGGPGGYGASATGPSYGQGYGPGNPGMAPGGGMMPGGARSGMMGVGLAAAGGVAAGMLAEKFLDRGHDARRDDNTLFDNDRSAGAAPALNDDGRALENRDVDFGNGQDWGSDDASSGGSSDTGGGGDDGGW